MQTSKWCCATLLAGSLAASGGEPAAAQSVQPATTRPFSVAPSETQRDDLYRAAIEVQLAWLADPVTCACRLEAHARGERLEVHGAVPDRSSREYALRIARRHCTLPVTDRLREEATPPQPSQRVNARDLHAAATAALRKEFPERKALLQATSAADGCVTISGSVASLEEKLAVSRVVQQVAGCRCVINVAQLRAAPTEVRQSTPSVAPKSAPPAPQAKSAAPARPLLPVWHRWKDGKVPPRADSAGSSEIAEVRPAPRQPQPRVDLAIPEAWPLPPTRPAEVKTKSAPAEVMPASASVPIVPKAANPAPNGTEVIQASAVVPAVPKVINGAPNSTSATAPKGAYETRGVVILDEQVVPASATSGKTAPKNNTRSKAPLTLPAPAPDPTLERLSKAIRLGCPAARNVRVTVVGLNELRVEVDARSVAESSTLAGQIFAIDALRPYLVDLQVHVPE